MGSKPVGRRLRAGIVSGQRKMDAERGCLLAIILRLPVDDSFCVADPSEEEDQGCALSNGKADVNGALWVFLS